MDNIYLPHRHDKALSGSGHSTIHYCCKCRCKDRNTPELFYVSPNPVTLFVSTALDIEHFFVLSIGACSDDTIFVAGWPKVHERGAAGRFHRRNN